jgi:ABC-type transport system involved in multi-copper enzyme maturation permease subunit
MTLDDLKHLPGDISVIRHIIRKEILENLLSLRFILSLLLVILLFAVSGFVFVGIYKQQTQDYWKTTNQNLATFKEQSSQLNNLPFFEQKIQKKPKPLTLCAGGFEKHLPSYLSADVFRIDLRNLKTSRSNFLLPRLSDVDWAFIISIQLSFIAMLFTYDSICGERGAGTLRLMLASSLPRHKILLGKYFGAVLTLCIPLLMGLLINLIIVISSGIVEMAALDWMKISVLVLLSFLYLSIFLLLGMFVSSRTSHPATSMVILLFIWVGLVILIPSLGRIICDIYYKSPSVTELRRQIVESVEQTEREMEAGKFGENAGGFNPDRNHPSNNPTAAARYWNAFSASTNRVFEQHHNRMLAQAFAGRNFACISPAMIYQRASEAIAGTGIDSCVNLYKQIKRYQEELTEFVRSEDQTNPDSLHLLFAMKLLVKNWLAISDKPVDFDSVPKFAEQDLSLGESLRSAIWDIGILVLFNMVFFTATFASFLRYDVR